MARRPGAIRRLRASLRGVRAAASRKTELEKLDRILEAAGRIEARQLAQLPMQRLSDREFTVYSQSGEDGIIQFLIEAVEVPRPYFVEFGVADYREANTRYLALNNKWSGLVIDSDPANVERIRADSVFWRTGLTAIPALVTRENINSLLREHGATGEIGLLSIDVDGNDYWLFDAIEVVAPAIVVVEYNWRFGSETSVTVPYDPHFNRWKAHHSGVYAGASLRALTNLAKRKGYAFVGCNSFGVNAFFVRRDLASDRIREVAVEEGFVAGPFREGRDSLGRVGYLSIAQEREILAALPVVEVERPAG